MIGKRLIRTTVSSAHFSPSRIVPGHGAVSSISIRTISASAVRSVPSWATADPKAMGVDRNPHAVRNLVGGSWASASDGSTAESITIPHPLDAEAPPIFTIPDTQKSELGSFLKSLRRVPKSGLHNPFKHPERYVQYGEISRKVSKMKM